MSRLFSALAALALLATPAMAQQTGGVQPHDSGGSVGHYLDRDPLSAFPAGGPGCPLANTQIATQTTTAFGAGSQVVQQRSASASTPAGCHPLVGIGIGAGVALALGKNSTAAQSVDVTAAHGSLANVRFGRAIGQAVGKNSTVIQQVGVH
ncbi:MAG TPA: hypothetical protein VKQ29_12465 [Aliidongia sp.]|nr:hypothetical protein [Aliidongia sp.]